MVATPVLGLKLLTATSERMGRRLLALAFGLVGVVCGAVVSTFSLVFIATSVLAHFRPIPSVVNERRFMGALDDNPIRSPVYRNCTFLVG